MIATSFQGKPAYLVPYAPDIGASKISVTWSHKTEEQRSVDGVEARRRLNSATVAKVDCALTLTGVHATDFRVSGQRLKNLTVLLPFWPSVRLATDAAPPLVSGLWFTFEPDLSAWEIHTAAAPANFVPSVEARRVPLLVGRFDKPAKCRPIGTHALQASFNFTERGPAAFALRSTAADGAPGLALPTGVTPKVFPLLPNWRDQPEAGEAVVEIISEDIGYGRAQAEAFFDQEAARPLQFTFTQGTLDQAAQLLAFFSARRGTAEAFWLQGAYDEALLAVATTPGQQYLVVDRAAALGDNRHFMLVGEDRSFEFLAVSSIDGNQLNLAAPLAAAYAPGKCRLVSAILSRFKQPQIKVDFLGNEISEGTLSFMEVPAELAPRVGETVGVTMGAQPDVAFGYRFSQYFSDQTIVNRYTNFDRDVLAAGELFLAEGVNAFEHGDIEESLQMDRSTCKLKSRKFPGNPLNLFQPFTLEVPLWCEVLEFEVNAEGTATAIKTLWRGKVGAFQSRGPIYECEIQHWLRTLSTPVPCALVGPACSKRFLGAKCGASEAAWTLMARVTAYDAATGEMTLDDFSRTGGGALPAIGENFFLLGRLYARPGVAYYSRAILASTPLSGGALTVVLNRALDRAADLNAYVNLVPGCAHTQEACAVFGGRYGGMPFVPNGNPTFAGAMKIDLTGSGGKK